MCLVRRFGPYKAFAVPLCDISIYVADITWDIVALTAGRRQWGKRCKIQRYFGVFEFYSQKQVVVNHCTSRTVRCKIQRYAAVFYFAEAIWSVWCSRRSVIRPLPSVLWQFRLLSIAFTAWTNNATCDTSQVLIKSKIIVRHCEGLKGLSEKKWNENNVLHEIYFVL
jgi:hypothetical protein